MKKYSAIALVLVLCITMLAGCRRNKNVPQTSAPTTPVTTQVTTAPTTLPITSDTGVTEDGMMTDTTDTTDGITEDTTVTDGTETTGQAAARTRRPY